MYKQMSINIINRKYYLVGSLLTIFAMIWLVSYGAVSSSTVTVSATVASSVSCSTDNTSTAFGTLTTATIATSTPNASTTISCNTGLGCTLSVNDANAGLATSSPAYTIPTRRGALSAATEGYGIRATTTATGSGGTLGVKSIYSVEGNNVGELNTTSTVLASSTASISSREVVVYHRAAISGTTQAASYADTITYSCAGN